MEINKNKINESFDIINKNIYKKYPFLKTSNNNSRLSFSEQAITYYNLEHLKSQKIREITMILVAIASLLVSITTIIFNIF
jgi:hypothetical protein